MMSQPNPTNSSTRFLSALITRRKGRAVRAAVTACGTVFLLGTQANATCTYVVDTFECSGWIWKQGVYEPSVGASGVYTTNSNAGLRPYAGNIRIHINSDAAIVNNGWGASVSADGISNNYGFAPEYGNGQVDSLTLVNDGQIIAYNLGGANAGIELSLAARSQLGPVTITNNGLISGYSQTSIGVLSFGQFTLNNSADGVIESTTGYGIFLNTVDSVIDNYGKITSGVPATLEAILSVNENSSDIVNLHDGTITGNISLRSGTDSLNWTGGLLVGDALMGTGSDSITVSAAGYTGTNRFDGGDDLSGIDGQVDTLTFSGLSAAIDSTLLTNWEQIVIESGSTISFTDMMATAGIAGEAGMGLITRAGGTLNAAGGLSVAGNLLNAGATTMQNSTPGDVLTVSGDYVGNGGILAVDTVLGDDVSATDRLVINGNATGNTGILVMNAGGGGAQTTQGILVVQVDGTSESTAFTLANTAPLEVGAFVYDLAFSDPGNTADMNWYLRSTGVVGTTGSVYETVPTALSGFNRLPTLEQRVGQRAWAGRDSETVGALAPSQGAWLRFYGDKVKVTPKTSTSGASSDTTTKGLQVGYDYALDPGTSGQWVLGVTAQYGQASGSVTNAIGFGNIKADGYGVGATATWYGTAGTYVDLQGQMNWLNADISSSGAGKLTTGQNMKAYALSAEVGHRFALNANSALVPQAQLTWGRIDGGSFKDAAGNAVTLGNNDSLIGRLGLAYEYEYSEGWLFGDRAAAGSKNHREKVYVIGNILHDFAGKSSVDVNAATLSTSGADTWAEVGLGGSIVWDENKTLYTEASYRRAINGGGRSNEGFAVTAGFRMQF